VSFSVHDGRSQQIFTARRYAVIVVVVTYVATSLVNKDDNIIIMLILQYKVSFTYDRIGPCLRFVYIYACIAVFLRCYPFSMNKDLYILYIVCQSVCPSVTSQCCIETTGRVELIFGTEACLK